jgi:DNA-binding transcriptional ArsR family regulator
MVNRMVERSKAARLDETYAALGHPVRREILAQLRDGPGTVTGLAEPFDLSLWAVSKHISVLEDASLLRRRVDGRVHHLTLEPAPLKEASAWLLAYREFWEGRLDALEEMLRGSRGRRRR